MSTAVETPPLQADYGGFNPRFLGISLFFDSPDSYNATLRFFMGDGESDDAKWDANGSLHDIVLRSVPDHEMRHYHDFIASPYSVAVFRLRLMALLNGAAALAMARRLPGDVVPVPLTRWALLGDAEREVVQREWAELLGAPAVPVPVPSWTRDELLTSLPAGHRSLSGVPDEQAFPLLVEMAVRAYLRIDQLTQGFAAADEHPFARPAYVHEASALTAQLAAIEVGQGIGAVIEFLDFLIESELPQARMWQIHLQAAIMLDGLISRGADPLRSARRILTISQWAMLGDFTNERQQACPASRINRLLGGLLSAHGDARWSCDLDDADDVRRMWDHWDEQVGVASWRTALRELEESSARAAETYRRLVAEAETESEAGGPKLVADAFDMVRRDQEQLLSALRDDPLVLVRPDAYVTHPAGLLPMADVRFEYRGFARTDQPEGFPGRFIERVGPSGESYVTGAVMPAELDDPRRRAELDRKVQIENTIEWCDLAFSELSVPDHVVASGRHGLQDLTDKRVLQLV